MTYETINFSIHQGVATIQLNRAQSMNSLEKKLMQEFQDITFKVASDDQIGAVILTGTGKAFCAGGDLRQMKEGIGPVEGRDYLAVSQPWLLRFVQMEKPVIAAVNGFAVGAGFSLAMLSDMVLASEEAIFSEAFVNVGLVPDLGSMYFLPRLVGLARAKELIFTGKQLSAKEAYELGIINKVVPAGKLMNEAQELAERLASGPRVALRLAKKILNLSVNLTLEELLEYESYAQAICFQTEDHREAAAAFFEKRKPSFKGR